MLGMISEQQRKANAAHALFFAGLAFMAAAAAWWLIYYSQWHGMFSLLDVKLSCISGDSFECSTFQNFIGPSMIPVYQPTLLWGGVVVTLIGLYLTRRNKA
ncbi:MAG: hypothetical protein ABI697_13750 [Devosia sp.]